METKRLLRSTVNRVIGGVCGGIGDYFNVDPVIIRILLIYSYFIKVYPFLFISFFIIFSGTLLLSLKQIGQLQDLFKLKYVFEKE